ncbi:hypothetical protein DI272_26390 [Streptomyces sp. Act143]|uniref:hypothetical protein n=1 Tax=Streptomyces sp. Act143 TaxID=2200760 RepID=UPI000D672AA1|nr:hypothetical protein [Streptomyces sp. Act143]PWI17294.1 hypothetical protein DI272_26390 [Streptomyces sp. Act143]
MRLRLTEYTPRLGPHQHRIVRPRTPLRHTSLSAPQPIGLLLGDHDGLNRLAGLFSFAACSRRTIVHVPLRDGVPPDEGWGERVDLVLAHHDAGLRASKWPELRRRLIHGTPLTVRTDEARTARDAEAWRARQGRADTREELRHATHARTFFLFGTRDVFAQTATDLAYAAGWGPHQKHAAEGHMAFMTALTLAEPPGTGGHPLEVDICYKPYPPYVHFRRPGERASRPRRPAAAP